MRPRLDRLCDHGCNDGPSLGKPAIVVPKHETYAAKAFDECESADGSKLRIFAQHVGQPVVRNSTAEMVDARWQRWAQQGRRRAQGARQGPGNQGGLDISLPGLRGFELPEDDWRVSHVSHFFALGSTRIGEPPRLTPPLRPAFKVRRGKRSARVSMSRNVPPSISSPYAALAKNILVMALQLGSRSPAMIAIELTT